MKKLFRIFKKKPCPRCAENTDEVKEFALAFQDRLLSLGAGYRTTLNQGVFKYNKKKLFRLEGAANAVDLIIKELDTTVKMEIEENGASLISIRRNKNEPADDKDGKEKHN